MSFALKNCTNLLHYHRVALFEKPQNFLWERNAGEWEMALKWVRPMTPAKTGGSWHISSGNKLLQNVLRRQRVICQRCRRTKGQWGKTFRGRAHTRICALIR